MAPVYAAKYSNVPVWVSTVKNVSVMRRQGDGWVNATHLLKVADFDKPRRTRILERDVQTGEHEKVQGGYGKYQGTWIPVERAIELSKQVGILDIVHDLLVYVPQEGVATAELPRPPKATAVSRKQSKQAAEGSAGGSGNTPKRARKMNSLPGNNNIASLGPRAQPMRSMPPNMNGSYAQMQWSPFSPHSPYSQNQQMQMSPHVQQQQQQQQQQSQSQHRQHHHHHQQQQQQQMGVSIAGMPQVPMAPMPGYPMGIPAGNMYQQHATPHRHHQQQQQYVTGPDGTPIAVIGHPQEGMYAGADPSGSGNPPRSGASSPSLSSSVLSSGSEGFSDDERPYLGGRGGSSLQDSRHRVNPSTGTEPVVAAMRSSGVMGQSSEYSPARAANSTAASMPGPSQYMADYSSKLLDFFMSPDKSIIPASLLHPQPGPHINQPIDDEGNTAFHWTCAIGKIELMQALLEAGANPKALNHAGQTPLVRAVMFTNNYEARTFPRVLEMLAETASFIDPGDRTIMHHVASTASSRSRAAGAHYYAEILLAKLSSSPRLLASTEFSAWLDHQDQRGDTALHIACRSDSRRLTKVLLSYNASPMIPNKAGITADELLRRAKHKRASEHDRTESLRREDKDAERGQSIAMTAAKDASAALTKYLSEIAKTYDTDLANKDSDISQVRQLLDRVRHRISESEKAISKLQDDIGSEQQFALETENLEQETRKKASELSQLIERTQARDLAIIVQKQETDSQEELKEELKSENFDEAEQINLSQQLNEMQRRRRSLVDEIVVLYSNAGNPEKIGKYRKLLAMCCEVPEDDVDGLLDGITQALGAQTA